MILLDGHFSPNLTRSGSQKPWTKIDSIYRRLMSRTTTSNITQYIAVFIYSFRIEFIANWEALHCMNRTPSLET